MTDEPDLYIFNPGDSPQGRAYREQRDRAREEARRRYQEYLATALELHGVPGDAGEISTVAVNALTDWRDVLDGSACLCSCHPTLPDSDHHDFGLGCRCQQSHETREANRRALIAAWEERRNSPEAQAERAEREAEEAEFQAWLATVEGVSVSSHGGWAPEQWWGEVDGHSFYFRERHEEWRIELDLRPSGRMAQAFRGTDQDGNMITELVDIEDGDVIAEGTTRAPGYGESPKDRALFIIRQIRTHLGKVGCAVHTRDLTTLGALVGADVLWCPACGERIGD